MPRPGSARRPASQAGHCARRAPVGSDALPSAAIIFSVSIGMRLCIYILRDASLQVRIVAWQMTASHATLRRAEMTRSSPTRRCLPDGWASNVRIVDRRTARSPASSRNAAAQPGDERHAILLPGDAQPAQPRLPARHGRARRNARAVGRQFLELARGDVPLRADDDAGPGRGGRRAALCRDAGGRLRRVGEFHYLHHDRDGQPYANIAEMAERIAAAAGATGISLTLLPVFYAHSGFGGAAPNDGQRRFINDLDALRTPARRKPARGRRRSTARSSASHRTACAR